MGDKKGNWGIKKRSRWEDLVGPYARHYNGLSAPITYVWRNQPIMEYRRLGSAGLKVSALSIGAWVTFFDF